MDEDRLFTICLQRVAKRGADASHELVHSKRLYDVIIGAETECLDLVILVVATRQDYDRLLYAASA